MNSQLKNIVFSLLCITSRSIISQNLPPVASFSPVTYTSCAGAAITFTDLSTNSPNSWTWYVPPGVSGSNIYFSNPTFTFGNVGIYSLKLTVSNAYGSDTAIGQITVNPNPTIT